MLLAPVWVSSFKYGGKNYRVLINGQTGQIGGTRPVNRKKILIMILIYAAISLSISLLAIYLRNLGFFP